MFLFVMKLMDLELFSIFWFYLLLFALGAPQTETIRLVYRQNSETAVQTGSILNTPTLVRPCLRGLIRIKKKCRKPAKF